MIGFLSLQMLGGRSLTVSFPQSNRADRSHPLPQREFGSNGGGGGSGSYDSENNLFVGNLSWGVDDASLQTMFSDYGKVVDARVVYDRETGRSHGFGFLTLSTAAEVNDAIQNLDGVVSQVSTSDLTTVLACSFSCSVLHLRCYRLCIQILTIYCLIGCVP
jgi:RNA recognition motif-containing protein